ncbi:hypothetical protein MBRU_16130 [Mycolicibacterium brumae DSM 44177]|nr:hypothetical protein MBRU_16130 [Mycolicibacterium brumae DSM 44177]
MGEVYLAQHPRLPRRDALKVLRSDISSDPDYIERFNREANLAAKLWHPNIVGVHDCGKYRGRLWISMEFVDGTDAGHLLQQHPDGMATEEVLDIVNGVAAALDYAHGHGFVHRDVKPSNILIASAADGRALLADFGVARDVADQDSAGLTATNMTVGTTAYAAPEQLMGLEIDGRADQYSLAATAYHLLTGEQLFPHTNPAVVISKHLNAPAPSLSGNRADLAPLDLVLARALAKDPERRYPSCVEFARALQNAAEDVPVAPSPSFNTDETMIAPVAVATPPVPAALPSEPPMPSQPDAPSARRINFLLGATVIALVAALGVLAFVVLKPEAVNRDAGSFSLVGSVRLASDVEEKTSAGYACAGVNDFADIGSSTPILVEDETGKLLAKGSIQSSSRVREACLLTFEVSDVPAGSRFYRVQIGQHHEMSYTEDEARAGVEFMLGETARPTPTTSAEPSKPAPTHTVTVTPGPSPEQQALARLQAIAAEDGPVVAVNLADRWIPQISSKRVGLVAKGITWNNEAILREHLRLRSIYPAVKLLWSGDWSTFDGQNFWVTVVGVWSYDYDDILSWCTEEGFDRDNCIAKWVSMTHPVEGSTKFNP